MSKTITFKLYGAEVDLALAFQNHCQSNLNVHDALPILIKRQFLKFLYDNIDRSPDQGAPNVAVTDGDTAADTDPRSGPASAGQADTEGDTVVTAATT